MASSQKNVQRIGNLVSQLMSRRGYAQSAANDQFLSAFAEVAGEGIANEITIGKLNRGVLKVFAGDSVTVQELTFQKRAILKRIQTSMPQAKVTDIRFGVQTK
ncbi:DUF721 domain-containing protein [Stieleria sp. JC731]|uniref:DUF721 domain-containing protein n=1 Tax=Pirellulaceae TaxID=2691357 RepID=UPI001E4A2CD6|nr:DUF721 domain-containing protein [Stieleria sp. JC731]MCC9600867.1 DUF721 domain-containing protein [Stieleria sp. JC731]